MSVHDEFLRRLSPASHSLFDFPLRGRKFPVPDLSSGNPLAAEIQVEDDQAVFDFFEKMTKSHPNTLWVGGYGEDRIWYQRSENYLTPEGYRSVHLGIDCWLPAGTPVHAPLNAQVHSFADNAGKGNYGPTIILQHEENGQEFFTLYGHLSRESLEKVSIGQAITAGQIFAKLGSPAENGQWPAHLHFQLVFDLEGKKGDFPGVAAPGQAGKYLENCPDPNLLLGMDLS